MEKVAELAIKEVSNFLKLEDKATYLRVKLDLLNSREEDVLTELQKEESLTRGMKRKKEVANWLKNVDEKRRECEKSIEDATNCSNISVARLNLPRQVEQKVKEVMELVEQSRCFQGLVLDAAEPKKVPLVTSRAQGHAFVHNLGKVMACVMDDNISSIGIHGMGGVGKTTLALQVHDNFLRESKFGGCVYWIAVSHDFTIYRLQKDIAKAAGIDLSDEEDEKKRAGILHFHLKKKLNFVLILDDVWKGFDAQKIGVPLEGRKLLVTSRLEQVCRMMCSNTVIKVEVLSEKEAWELFQEKLKTSPTSHLKLEADAIVIAQEVARKCAGLPLGIITMGGSMRGVTDIHEWRNALEELKESFTKHEDMENEVLPILLYSYNRLRNPILQTCFLYCSLYPEDYAIKKYELIRGFINEEIMDKRSTRQSEIDQGYAILSKLESACLLVGCKNFNRDECVKMHDLIRDLALWVTRENPRFMVKSGMQLLEVPPENEWTVDLNRVSLMHNQISLIPNGISPRCPTLSSLYLNRNPLTSLADSIFEHMKSLKTLDLSGTKIVALPYSISSLVNLKALLLRNCNRIVSLPSLENLKALTELDLYNTSIEDGIHGLESLINLKCLEFSHYKGVDTPLPLALHRLTSLQRFILSEDKLVNVYEGKNLRHLEELQGRFASIDEFKQFIISMNSQCQLRFCHVLVGESKHNRFHGRMDSEIEKLDIIVRIRGEYMVEVAIADEMMLPLRDIGYLKIEDAKNMKCLSRISRQDVEVKNRSALESLKELCLFDLPKLKNIIEWEGATYTIIRPPPAATFSCLTNLTIEYCNGMKKLLPMCLVGNFRNLEVLYIKGCSGMEEIIGEDNECEENRGTATTTTSHVITLPKLKKLYFWFLPELKSICKSTLICNSIQVITIHGCRKLKKIQLSFPLLNGQQSPPSALEEIFISNSEREWWDSLEWDHPHHKVILEPRICFKFQLPKLITLSSLSCPQNVVV